MLHRKCLYIKSCCILEDSYIQWTHPMESFLNVLLLYEVWKVSNKKFLVGIIVVMLMALKGSRDDREI